MSDISTTRTFEPGSIAEAYELAKILVSSRLLPEGVSTPEAAFAIIATGRELGLSAMQSLRSIHVIKGKPCLSADLICALIKSRSDVCEYFRTVETTHLVARYETKRRGEPEPTTMEFSIEDAKRANLTGNPNWSKFPSAMLRARCITALARAVYPDLALGLYDPDELQDSQSAPAPSRAAMVEPAPMTVEVRQISAPVATGRAESLMAAIASAETMPDLNKLAVSAKGTHSDGLIDDAQLQALASAVRARRVALSEASK